MTHSKYLASPQPLATMPPGVPYIIGNEAAERFCFYGMRTILVVFMTRFLLNSQGSLAVMSEEEAKGYYHLFVAGVYFFPILGAILADAVLGKYGTILYLSLVYCLGNFSLAADQTRLGLFLGLLLITIGAGGIKSSVSANVGDQFGPKNHHLLEKVFGWFYFSINFGSFFSTLLTPVLLDHFSRTDLYGERAKHLGPCIAFGVPGVLMVMATLVFWMGRKKFVHIPPAGSAMLKEAASWEGVKVIAKLGFLFLVFIAMFWALYEQTGAAWVLQAEKMDRHWLAWLRPVEDSLVSAGMTFVGGLSQSEIKAAQVQAINPLLIMFLIPLFSYGLYPAVNRIVKLTPLRKVATGLFFTVLAFAISGYAETLIAPDRQPPTIWWQLLAFVIITVAEVMVSITCLEFAYTQAPKKMKSLIMGLFMLSETVGNAFLHSQEGRHEPTSRRQLLLVLHDPDAHHHTAILRVRRVLPGEELHSGRCRDASIALARIAAAVSRRFSKRVAGCQRSVQRVRVGQQERQQQRQIGDACQKHATRVLPVLGGSQLQREQEQCQAQQQRHCSKQIAGNATERHHQSQGQERQRVKHNQQAGEPSVGIDHGQQAIAGIGVVGSVQPHEREEMGYLPHEKDCSQQ
jgi:POT family proton-dependent oligopeptide transporter